MDWLPIYIGSVATIFLLMSLGAGIKSSTEQNFKTYAISSLSIFAELTVCSLGYVVFFFIAMMALGIAVWLVLLGLVYLPADFMNNIFGDNWSRDVVASLRPWVNRSYQTPGFFHQPIMDYSSLCVLVLAPLAGIRTLINKYHIRYTPLKKTHISKA
ncbi:hypothetical protein [Kaarinaea lacus]